MLEIKNLTFSYDNEKYLYEDTSLTFKNNGIYYLKGDNGTGKSTLFKIIKGLINTNGNVLVDGENNSKAITLVDYNLIIEHKITVYEQCLMMTDDVVALDQMFNDFNITYLKNKKASKLSQGEKAKVAFILGILDNNNIIIIDEIFSHLDSKSSSMITNYIYKLSKSKIIIYSAHKGYDKINYNYLIEIKDRKLVMTECEFKIEVEEFNTPKYNINTKYIQKVLNYNSLYIVNLLMIIIVAFIGYLFFTLSVTKSLVSDMYIKNSNLRPYVVGYVSRDYEHGYNFANVSEHVIPDSNKAKLYKNSNYNYISNSETKLNKFFTISGFFVDDNLNLKDNEVIMYDYDYFILKCLHSNIVGEEPLQDNTFTLYDEEFYIKEVIDTGFVQKLGSFRFDESIYMSNRRLHELLPKEIYSDKDFKKLYNHYYNNIYVNSNLYNKLLNLRESYYKNSISNIMFDGKKTDNKYSFDENLDFSDNSVSFLPVYLNNKYKNDYNLKDPFKIEFNQTLFYTYKRELYCEVLGFFDGDYDFVLKDKETVDKWLLNNEKGDFAEFSLLDNYTLDDLDKIYEDDDVIFEGYDKFNNKVRSINVMKRNNTISIILLSFLTIVSFGLYLFYILNYRHKSFMILKHKNIDNRIIYKYNRLYFVKILMFIMLISSITLFLLTYYNVYYSIIYKLFFIN